MPAQQTSGSKISSGIITAINYRARSQIFGGGWNVQRIEPSGRFALQIDTSLLCLTPEDVWEHPRGVLAGDWRSAHNPLTFAVGGVLILPAPSVGWVSDLQAGKNKFDWLMIPSLQ